MASLLEKDSTGKTKLIRLIQNKEYEAVGPFLKTVKRQVPDPKKFIDYLEMEDNDGKYALNYATNSIKRFLIDEYKIAKQIIVSSTDVSYLFRCLNNLTFNSRLYIDVLDRLVYLSFEDPTSFVSYEGLMEGLQNIVNDNVALYSNVYEILSNITMEFDNVPIIKRHFRKFVESTDKNTDVLLGILKQLRVFHSSFDNVFNMRTIMASETPHVYALLGHGCVHMKDPFERLTVPDGIIWIEMAVCGRFSYANPFAEFIRDEIRDFFISTPIPTDEPSRIEYQNFLYQNFSDTVQAKFPGDKIASGNNTLFSNYKQHYLKSGIHRLYEPRKNAIEYIRKIGSPMNDALIRSIYSGSIYPTVDAAIASKEHLTMFTIEIEDIFENIRSQTYVANKPMIIINSGCRIPCGQITELNGPSLERHESETTQSNLIRKLSTEDLTHVKPDGSTRLMYFIREKLYVQAKELVDRMVVELDPKEFMEYLHRTVDKTDSGEESAFDMIPDDNEEIKEYLHRKFHEAQMRAQQQDDLILARITPSEDVAFLFDQLIINKTKPTICTVIIHKLKNLSLSHPDDFIRYSDLVLSILKFIEQNNFMWRYLFIIFSNLVSSPERKAALTAKIEVFIRENPDYKLEIMSDFKRYTRAAAGINLAGGYRSTRKRQKRVKKRLSRRIL